MRQLGRDLGINLHTVNKAYKVLEDEGYLKVVKRKGAIVGKPPQYDRPYLEQLENELSALYIDACSHGVTAPLFIQAAQNATRADSDISEAVSEPEDPKSTIQNAESIRSSSQKGA